MPLSSTLPRIQKNPEFVLDLGKRRAQHGDRALFEYRSSGNMCVAILQIKDDKPRLTHLVRQPRLTAAAFSPSGEFAVLLFGDVVYLYRFGDGDPERLLSGKKLRDIGGNMLSTAVAISDNGVIAVGLKSGVVRTYMGDGHPIHDQSYSREEDASVADLAFIGGRLFVTYEKVTNMVDVQ